MMADRELRCPGNILFGLIVDEGASGTLEVKCHSKFCGRAPDTVVLHRFNLGDGAINTMRYKEPRKDT